MSKPLFCQGCTHEAYRAFVDAIIAKTTVCPVCSYLWSECECGITTAPAESPEHELVAWSVSGVMNWMQKHRRTDVIIQCGHCLTVVGGFKEFCIHMLTCELGPTKTALKQGYKPKSDPR